MKKLLLIITVILTSVSAAWAEDYAINFDKNVKYYDYRKEHFRWIEQIGLRIEGYSDQILSTGFQNCYNSTNYTDLTSDTKLAARIGQTVTPLWKQNTNAMFGWVYIDLNNDGDFEDENERIGTSEEWHDVTTSTLSTSNSFVIPNTTPGDYHIRFNVAWTDNPKGYSSILSDGGSITDAIITIVASSEYTVATNANVKLSDIPYFIYDSFNVPAGSTLVVDVDNFDLTKIKGSGNVILDANTSLANGKNTSATGTLTVNEGKTLTMGSGENSNASIKSFANVVLKGILHYNTQTNELNNLTIPENNTGVIFSDDMGDENSGFKISLTGTTTINSGANLITCNHWNFKLEISKLTGSGTWEICGTGNSSYSYEHQSTERSLNTVNDASEFTGTINLNNDPSKNGDNSTVTVGGNLVGCTLKKTTGDYFYYSGANLNGTTLDGVILTGSSRITTSNEVTIKNLAGNNLNNLPNSDHNYVFVGSGTLNFEGTCDLTKKSDGTTSNSNSKVGYDGNSTINIKTGANITAGAIFNTETLNGDNNASLKVESNATLNCSNAKIHSLECTNNGTLSATKIYGVVYFTQGSTTTLSDAEPLNATTTVSGDATLNLTASTSALNQPFIIDSEKTLSINGSSTVNFTGAISGAGNIVLNYFPTASSHPIITNVWTGSIEFAAGGSSNTDLTSLFNAWGNENSTIKLNNVSGGYLLTYDSNNQNTIVNPTLNILTGKTLTLNNGNSGANARLSKVTGAGTIDRQKWGSWPNYSSNHNLYITTLDNFTGTLKGTGHPIIVENLVRTDAPTIDELLFKTSGTVTFTKSDSKLFIGNVDKTDAYAWQEKTISSIKGYYITESAPAKIEAAKNEVSPYIGTGTGKYSITFDGKIYTEFETFAADVDKLQTLADWTNKTISYSTINQPTTGYYYIKSKYNESTGYYLSCENKSNSDDTNADQTTTVDDKVIFYINVDNNGSTIKSYYTGYYFGKHTRANYTEDPNTPAKWTFSEGYNKGTYQLTSNVKEYTGQNLNGQILYGWSGSKSGIYAQYKADRNAEATTDGHTDWILIPVPAFKDKTSTEAKPAILGNITSTDDVTNNITASAKFVDLSQATIGTSIDEIKAAVDAINPNAIIIAPQGTDVNEDNTSNVLVKTNTAGTYKCENLQLNDDVIAQFTTKTNFTADTKVTYTRAATDSGWGTIYLPYEPKAEDGVTYYKLKESSGSYLKFTKVDNPSANTPYMYKKESEGEMSVTNDTEVGFSLVGDKDKYEGEPDDNGYQLVGILTNSSIVQNDGIDEKTGYNKITDPNAYYFKNTDNTFRPMPKSNIFSMKAFRCYLTSSTNARQNVLGFSYEDNGQPTGVSIIESEDGNTVDVIFDLNGRRLQNAKKGINIINGKKVIK